MTFIIAIGRKVLNRRRQSGVTKNVSDGAIDRRITAAGFLISWTTPVADHRDDKSVLYTRALVLVGRQPSDGPDCPGSEHKPITVTRSQSDHSLCEMRQQRQSGAIVICERRVANMR